MSAAYTIAFGAALGGALYGILCGIVLHRIVGAYIEGGIGPCGCLLFGGIFLAISVAVVVFHSVAIFVLLVLLVALSPLLSRRVEKMEHHRFYDERIQQHMEALRVDPRNLAARSALADALSKRGYIDEAIEQYGEVLRAAPNSREEAYKLKHLIQEREERRDPPITCPSCGQRNPKSRLHCTNCEASLASMDKLREWLSGPTYKQFARHLAIAAGVTILILLLGSLLSPIGKTIAILATVAVLGIAFLVNTYMNA